MRTPQLALSILCAISLCACRRDRTPPYEDPSTVLKRMEWKDGSHESWSYDANGNLQRTAGAGPTTSAIERDYLYIGRTLGLLQKTSIKEDTFFYNSNHRISRIEEYEMGLRQEGGNRLDFTYDGNGKVIRMEYSRYKGATSQVQSVSFYTWNDKGLLIQIKTTSPGNANEYTYNFTQNTRGFVFDPWAFVNRYHLVDFQYELWNIPIMQCMERLPTRIMWTRKTNGQVAEQSGWDFQYDVDKFGRLTRRTTGTGDWVKLFY